MIDEGLTLCNQMEAFLGGCMRVKPKIGQLVFGFVTKIKEGGEET